MSIRYNLGLGAYLNVEHSPVNVTLEFSTDGGHQSPMFTLETLDKLIDTLEDVYGVLYVRLGMDDE